MQRRVVTIYLGSLELIEWLVGYTRRRGLAFDRSCGTRFPRFSRLRAAKFSTNVEHAQVNKQPSYLHGYPSVTHCLPRSTVQSGRAGLRFIQRFTYRQIRERAAPRSLGGAPRKGEQNKCAGNLIQIHDLFYSLNFNYFASPSPLFSSPYHGAEECSRYAPRLDVDLTSP